MTLAAVAMAATMNAQGYIGGGVGFESSSSDGNSDTYFMIQPEVGYNLSDNLAVGVMIGYGENKLTLKDAHGNKVSGKVKAFTINPYLRYTFAKFDKVNLFLDGGISYTNTKETASAVGGEDVKNNTFGIGIKPGVAVNLTDKLTFVSHFGFIGYENSKDDYEGAKAVNTFGAKIDATSLSFGLYYNF